MRLDGSTTRLSKVIKTALPLFLLFLPTAILYAANPLIRIDNPDYDFGKIYNGETAEHVFIIRNHGGSPLEIKNVRSSCGCTVTTIGKRTLEPQESTELKAVFDSRRFRGEVIKNIYVYSNDPENPIKKLSVRADVQMDLEVSPSTVYLSGLKAGEKVERNLFIKNFSSETVKIKEIASTVSSINLELSKMNIEPGDSASLKLVIDEIKKDMKLTGELTIFNTSHQPEFKVRVYGGMIK
jgi:hypothetical protein